MFRSDPWLHTGNPKWCWGFEPGLQPHANQVPLFLNGWFLWPNSSSQCENQHSSQLLCTWDEKDRVTRAQPLLTIPRCRLKFHTKCYNNIHQKSPCWPTPHGVQHCIGQRKRIRSRRVEDHEGYLKSFSLRSSCHLVPCSLQNLLMLTTCLFYKWNLHFKSRVWKGIILASKVTSWVDEWQLNFKS